MNTLEPARTYNQNHIRAQIYTRQTPPEHLLDLELSVGIAA